MRVVEPISPSYSLRYVRYSIAMLGPLQVISCHLRQVAVASFQVVVVEGHAGILAAHTAVEAPWAAEHPYMLRVEVVGHASCQDEEVPVTQTVSRRHFHFPSEDNVLPWVQSLAVVEARSEAFRRRTHSLRTALQRSLAADSDGSCSSFVGQLNWA